MRSIETKILRAAAWMLWSVCPGTFAAERVPLSNAVEVDSQHESACAVVANGEVFCWGKNDFGQLGRGNTISSTLALPLYDLAGLATKIAVGGQFACALLESRKVQCWGIALDYQLGGSTPRDGTVPGDVPGLPADVAGITAGGAHACAWTTGGALYCWGRNLEGQLGRGPRTQRATSGPVTLASGVSFASAGDAHTCVVLNGRPYCFGDDAQGQVDGTPGTSVVSPVPVPAPDGTVLRVAAGRWHSCALYDNRAVRCWGANLQGQLGSGDYTATPFRQVSGIAGTSTDIAAGMYHTCARMVDGPMRCWGDNFRGALGNENVAQAHSAMPVPGLTNVTSMGHGIFSSCAVASGTVHCWGDSLPGVTGHGARGFQAEPSNVQHGLPDVRELSVGHDGGACVLATDGRVQCWGRNSSGQLATGNQDTARGPVAARVPPGVVQLSRGQLNCGVTSAGAVHCAGALPTQNAQNSTVLATQMTPIAALSQNVAVIATRGMHACALIAGGQVRCWGANHDGQLGDGTTTFRQTPVAPQGLPPGILEVRVSHSHTCARTASALYCWGANNGGQVGTGSTLEEVTVPQMVSLPAAPTALGLGSGTSCALVTGGDVYCWGINGNAQLGDGTLVQRSQPVKVLGLSAVTRIAVGASHACALQSDGLVDCWGTNYYGELGVPVDAVSTSKTAIPSTHAPANLVDIAAGNASTCGRDASHRVWCWGIDTSGELGDGGSSPFAVGPVVHFNRDHVHADGLEPPVPGDDAFYGE